MVTVEPGRIFQQTQDKKLKKRALSRAMRGAILSKYLRFVDGS